MKLKPSKTRVLVEALPQKTIGGLVIAETKDKPESGKIIAIGTSVKEWKVGDIVHYSNYSSLPVGEFFAVQAEDILAKEVK